MTEESAASGPKRLIVLVSHGVSDRAQASHQNMAFNILKARKVPYTEVDGMDLEQKERRNQLFEISKIRANYPQFFFEEKGGSVSFVGNWEYVEGLNEASSLSEEILQANPGIKTWDSVFNNVVASFA